MKIDRSIIQAPANASANVYPERPVPGVYPVIITDVQDVPGESHLKIWYDFADGPFKGYFGRLRAEHPDWDWLGMYCRYYTPAAMWAFDRFCNAVSRSNGGFTFDGEINADEKTLVGKKMGLVIRGKEYYSNSGDLRIKLDVVKEVPVDRIPYESVPEVLTIAKQEEIKARKAARQAARQSTPAPAPAPAQPAPAPAQAFAQQPQQVTQPAQAPAYQQAPAQAVARQTAAPTYARPQAQPAQQAYTQNPALAQFVDVSGDTEMMPFM